jgi:hypothetical protein
MGSADQIDGNKRLALATTKYRFPTFVILGTFNPVTQSSKRLLTPDISAHPHNTLTIGHAWS